MMTCAVGEARCQEKAALEKCPANQIYILYNKDTCFVQASQGFLIGLKESCQDYYRRVNMSHSNSSPSFLCSFAFENSSAEDEGTVFIWKFLVFQSHKGQTIDTWNTDDSTKYFPYAPRLGSKMKTFCSMYHMLEITWIRGSLSKGIT